MAFAVSPGSGDGLFECQSYESYSADDHAAWSQIYGRMKEPWDRYASERFLEGLQSLHLPPARVPRLDEVNAFLLPRSGFRASAVSGRMPVCLFFDCLRNRVLPTATGIRRDGSSDHTSELNIFHDIAGRVPMHADRSFAETLLALGECAHIAAERAGQVRDRAKRLCGLMSMLKALARFYWFAVDFGLVRYGNRLKAYGSGLLSSAGEIERAIGSPRVQRCELRLDWVIHQPFEANHGQPLLFIVESFDHLRELTATLERWLRQGRLDDVARGEPELSPAGLEIFLEACGSH